MAHPHRHTIGVQFTGPDVPDGDDGAHFHRVAGEKTSTDGGSATHTHTLDGRKTSKPLALDDSSKHKKKKKKKKKKKSGPVYSALEANTVPGYSPNIPDRFKEKVTELDKMRSEIMEELGDDLFNEKMTELTKKFKSILADREADRLTGAQVRGLWEWMNEIERSLHNKLNTVRATLKPVMDYYKK